ncbi:molybdopterin molybdotransferase MoeA [Parazoarcus communis]|uniref:Molybdopterin molybdenumtransferase n=1 Tax=Parazoarcus communis SWub3 = DSM 12120 TaxID=1121029 RepID=A0A323UVS3_9RHOO|nr:gephyrin-like molybdotransferase Glp [Parazoarcus communis]NMG70783.1 molybdopterin molybdenumtransferase MoeA [Parazoarcus communis SWub3 = DSM 12120]PZA16341.1 molybdopterin molybdenumtransferase MoeA [Azoarcus communis] [Parazoarcus communis SWub3 = DSM 12120]
MNANMLTFDEAYTQLLGHVRPVREIEEIDTMMAAGRVLAVSQHSPIAQPPMDNSAMDGYALRVADVPESGTRLPVSQRIPAGSVGTALQPGTAARIFTGAPLPEGADAVVMQELCEHDGDAVVVNHVPRLGEAVRRTGEDVALGAEVLGAGVRLRPQELALAASVGLARLPVLRRMRVAVFSTGSELVMPGEPLPPGGIYNSNRFMLRALLTQLGCEVTDLGIVPDNLEATRKVLREAAQGNDLIVTSGGVSVGEEDHVKPAVEAEGSLDMWKIAMKPGKPLAYGRVHGAAFIGLPGNPVSSFVTFLLMVRPFILATQGAIEVAPQAVLLTAGFDWTKPDRRREFLRARMTAAGTVELFSNQGAAALNSTTWANGLVDIPAGQAVAAGDKVRFLPYGDLLW